MRRKIVISGGRGFIGQALSAYLQSQGYDVAILPRMGALPEDVNVLINLSGENIFGRWNKKKKQKIRDSRLKTTAFLVSQIKNLKKPLELYIGASAIGYYGDRGNLKIDESSPPGNDFLAEVCKDWERAAEPLQNSGTRVVYTRFGVVLDPHGGALKKMLFPFKMGLGGVLGSGKQYMSWISLKDLKLAISFLIENPKLSGPVNLTSPSPVTNAEFTKTLGRYLKRKTFFPVPGFILRLFLGEGAQVVLTSALVYPQKLTEAGFAFEYPTLEDLFLHVLHPQ